MTSMTDTIINLLIKYYSKPIRYKCKYKICIQYKFKILQLVPTTYLSEYEVHFI